MHRKGINYNTGITIFCNRVSRESFDLGQVRCEMEIIVHDLHCTAVRISGRGPHRIALAAEYALGEGLEVWFAPFPCVFRPHGKCYDTAMNVSWHKA